MTELYGERLGAGAFVDGYVVVAPAGDGASSQVYRADGPRGPVALKVLRRSLVANAVALRRFADEAHCLRAVTHPHLVRLEASGDLSDGRPWLALEWLEGETCSRRLAREGAQPAERVAEIVGAVAQALEALHAAGLVHRDVSAQNVMLCAGRVVLLDFGVARSERRSTQLTSTGHLLGTPIALAPEVLRGEPASPASDWYALGVLGWTLLHGAPPFRAPSVFELTQLHARGEIPAWKRADAAWLEPAIRRCLAASTSARPSSASELITLLRRSKPCAVNVYVCPHGDSDDFDAWDEKLREGARGFGLLLEADGAATLWSLRALDDEDARAWKARLEAWLASLPVPAGMSIEIRVTIEAVS
ncbi:MAG: serine/threonine-protein kinase [Archangium sp.]